MKIGIVGLPNVGKSTLFKALTKIQVDINNYPFCTIEPNVGIVEVPDERVDKLAQLSNSAKKIYSAIEFVDIAGLVKGASKGEGLGNKFLHNIREVDAIAQVVRVFKNSDIAHVHETINPKRDMEIINTELILADLQTVESRIAKIKKEARGEDEKAKKVLKLIQGLKQALDTNQISKVQEFIKNLGEDFKLIKDLQLLSFKPILYILNADESQDIKKIVTNYQLPVTNYLSLDIKTEEELLELSNEEKMELELKSELSELIKKSYQMLGLITFFTTGEDETRAWTVPEGSAAPRAGRAIHGDFEEKFICAEVISYEELIRIGSYSAAREKGLLRTEGRGYIVQDGDVIEFKI